MSRFITCAILAPMALIVSLLTSPSVAQQRKVFAPHRPIPPKVGRPINGGTPPMLRSMVGGLWMTDANWNSSIYLRNIVETDPITVTPILYLSNGTKYVLADVKLEPAGISILSINQALSKKGISSWATLSGYVELQYTWAWDPLCATIRNVDTVHSLIFTYGLRPITPLSLPLLDWTPPVPSHTIEGMWWKHEPNVTGFVTLANISSQTTQASVQVMDGAAKLLGEYKVTISPHGMKLVNLAALGGATGTHGGIRIVSSATTDQLVVNGGLKDPASGYSAVLPFSTGDIRKETPSDITLAALGLMAGAADPMMLFPAGTTFTPYSVLRNVGDASLSISPTLWWMEGAAAHSAQLPRIDLAPFETRALDLMSLLSAFGPKNFNGSFNLALDTNAKPGSLLVASGSVDQTNSYVFEVNTEFIAEGGGRSLQYWSIGNGDDTMVTVWNAADDAQDFVITLFFAGGRYALPLHLEARATRMFNISEIVHNQIPDADGSIIPADVHEGGFKISGSRAENESILVGIEAGTYNVRKATCGMVCETCNGYTGMFIIDSPFGVAVSATHQLNSYGNWNTGGQYTMTSSGPWSSDHTNIATVSVGLVSGVSSGSATATFTYYNAPVGVGYICHSNNTGCPTSTFGPSSPGSVVRVTISIRSSGSASLDNSARGAYNSVTGRYGLGNFVDTNGFCTIGYEGVGAVTPSGYTGTITLVRTKGGKDYKGSNGQTLDQSFANGTNDTSDPSLEDTDPQSGGSAGKVYDLDAPGRKPATSEIWRKRMNFFENAQLPDGTYVATEVPFYVRLSCVWHSGGNTFATDVTGDNVLNSGTTPTTWNLQ